MGLGLSQQLSASILIDMIVSVQTMTFPGIIYPSHRELARQGSPTTPYVYNFLKKLAIVWHEIVFRKQRQTPLWCHQLCHRRTLWGKKWRWRDNSFDSASSIKAANSGKLNGIQGSYKQVNVTRHVELTMQAHSAIMSVMSSAKCCISSDIITILLTYWCKDSCCTLPANFLKVSYTAK